MANSLLFLLALGLFTLHTSAAALPSPDPLPAPAPFHEIIPGPGMPSLASLNLTSAQLLALPPPDHLHNTRAAAPVSAIEARDPAKWFCGPVERSYMDARKFFGCYHYLKSVGGKTCTALAGMKYWVLCEIEDAAVVVYGTPKANGENQATSCSNVADSVLWTLDHCTRADGTTAGYGSTVGNPDLMTALTRIGLSPGYTSGITKSGRPH